MPTIPSAPSPRPATPLPALLLGAAGGLAVGRPATLPQLAEATA